VLTTFLPPCADCLEILGDLTLLKPKGPVEYSRGIASRLPVAVPFHLIPFTYVDVAELQIATSLLSKGIMYQGRYSIDVPGHNSRT